MPARSLTELRRCPLPKAQSGSAHQLRQHRELRLLPPLPHLPPQLPQLPPPPGKAPVRGRMATAQPATLPTARTGQALFHCNVHHASIDMHVNAGLCGAMSLVARTVTPKLAHFAQRSAASRQFLATLRPVCCPLLNTLRDATMRAARAIRGSRHAWGQARGLSVVGLDDGSKREMTLYVKGFLSRGENPEQFGELHAAHVVGLALMHAARQTCGDSAIAPW